MLDFSGQPQLTTADLPSPHDFDTFEPFLKGVFSQWHPTQFAVDGQSYSCAEQFMMHGKACLFGDHHAADAILAAQTAAEHKRLGQLVRNFDQAVWDAWRLDIVHRGNLEKFAQNPGAARRLHNTAPAMLVEANLRDWNWGNGLAADDPANQEPDRWRGMNLLGRVLTKVRAELAV